MATPGLERSMVTFRRSGSSGLVWEDRVFSEDMIKSNNKEQGVEFRALKHSHSVGAVVLHMEERSKDDPYRATTRVLSPTIDPPSPRISGCGFLGIFRNNSAAAKRSKLPRSRR